jgi:hypothetical protein
MIVRNDDVNLDTQFSELQTFCNICDRHGFKIMQCITPKGIVEPIDSRMTNDKIREVVGDEYFSANKEVLDYLLSRDDIIAVHGLYHEHYPIEEDISRGKHLLLGWGFEPTYYVPPFNEYRGDDIVLGLKVSAKTQRLEDYHKGGIPTDEIAYLHHWRYFRKNWYPVEVLDLTLSRIANGG